MKGSEHLSLLITAGDGPAECHQAVAHILKRMGEEAEMRGLSLAIDEVDDQFGPKSAVVVVYGDSRIAFAKSWVGTVRWRMQSQLRKNHKRSNWFVGVFLLPSAQAHSADIRKGDVAFSTLRAGGPGGQHQNTTDSAVRAVHKPSGLAVVVRDGRSQHRNKVLALERLQNLADAKWVSDEEAMKRGVHKLHHALERGNPVRRFSGEKFREDA